MDQPEWVIADFNTFGLLEAWLDLDVRTRAESEALHPTVQDA